jgi:hypothetical protein
MTTGIKAIETSYKGYRFRSRLEARWAVFFDALGWEWDYEPEGFELEIATGDGELKHARYLPDFKMLLPMVLCNSGDSEEMAPEARNLTWWQIDSSADSETVWWEIKPNLADWQEDNNFEKWEAFTSSGNKLCVTFGLPDAFFNRSFADHLRSNPPRFKIIQQTILGFIHAGEGEGGALHTDVMPSMERAFDAARSARFEFGENGR